MRLFAGNVGRVVILVLLLLAAGGAAGLAIGYPLRSLDIGADTAVVLDQSALTGIDLSDALIAPDDLPTTFAESPELATQVDLSASEFCGGTVPLDASASARSSRAFIDPTNNALVLSQAVRAKDTTSASRYVQQMVTLLDRCDNGRYFKVEGEERIEVRITNPRRDVPLKLDYLTRTIVPVKGGTSQIVTYFQVGNVVVALQYAGPERAYESLMEDAEKKILIRLVPDQFAETVQIDGEQPIPTDAPSTTRADAAAASPTSSVDYTTEELPPATFEAERTTTTRSGG